MQGSTGRASPSRAQTVFEFVISQEFCLPGIAHIKAFGENASQFLRCVMNKVFPGWMIVVGIVIVITVPLPHPALAHAGTNSPGVSYAQTITALIPTSSQCTEPDPWQKGAVSCLLHSVTNNKQGHCSLPRSPARSLQIQYSIN